MKTKSQFLALAPLLLGLLASSAAAQLDLPDAPRKPAGSDGVELGGRPRGDVAPKPTRPGAEGPDLGPAPAPAASDPQVAPTEVPEEPGGPGVSAGAGEAILELLAGLSKPDADLIADAAHSLASMGPEGYEAARRSLDREEPAVFLAAVQTLLEGGAESDRFLVLRRLDRKLPGRAAGPAVDLVSALPRKDALDGLVSLCNHRQGTVRRQAAEHLEAFGAELPTSSLLKLVGSTKSDTRELGYGLMALPELVARTELSEYLLLGLEDGTARVAWAAAAALASRLTGPADPLLADLSAAARLRSFDDRRGAFALLALAEAEDRLGAPLLSLSEATTLLIQLRSGSPFVAASCAVSLAGLGFRSEGDTAWLDLEVTHALVQAVVGDLYFAEYGVVRPPALRRLTQLTGRNFGDDGPRWREWWVANMDGFQALRAVLPISAEDHVGLEVRWFDPLEAKSFRLLGSLAAPDEEPFVGSTLRLVPDQSLGLYASLDAAGLFGAERLPGLLGRATGVEPRLEVRHGRHVKVFRFGAGAQAEWRGPVLARLEELERKAAWQLYPSSEHGLTRAGREAFFRAESPWWSAEHSPAEEDRRLAELILDHMALLAPEERDRPLGRLAELMAAGTTLGGVDFEDLASLLADERFLGQRAMQLLELCLLAGADPLLDGQLSIEHAGRLVDLLYVADDSLRYEPLVRVLQRAPRSLLHEAGRDPRPGIRAVAATVLVQEQPELAPDTRELLDALLADGEVEVESATVLAIAGEGLIEYRDEVFLRARVGNPLVRVAALRGVARLGGPGALDVLRTAVLESEPAVRGAAAEALADLADPASTTLLLQMFAGGEVAPFFPAARRGLRAIGEPAWDGLLMLARTRNSPARKHAALLLSEQGVPEVASVLMTMLTEDASDGDLAEELAILTARDFRNQPDPVGAWWSWSDGVKDGDSVDWFVDAVMAEVEAGLALDLASAGIQLDAAELRQGSVAGTTSLVRLLEVGTLPHREERAERELRRILGPSLGSVPPPGSLRRTWCSVLVERLPELLAQRRAELGLREQDSQPAPLLPATVEEAP